MSVKKDIAALNKIVLRNVDVSGFSMYSKIYAFTTENIAGYYSKIDFKDKKVLTICSSGDHILNAILLGCNDIDCFDINIFTKYYMFLKVAAIKALDYDEFIEFFISDNKFSFELYNKIILFLDDEIKSFWDNIYQNYDINKVINKLFIKTDYIKTNVYYNLYLKMESYNLLKYKLLNDNILINFFQTDILELGRKIKKNYNYMFLSNIVDYLSSYYIDFQHRNYINFLQEYIMKKMTVEKIFYCYIYSYNVKINKILNTRVSYIIFDNMYKRNQVDSVGIIENV